MKVPRILIAAALGALVVWALACAALLIFSRDLIYPFREGIDAAQVVGVPRAEVKIVRAADGADIIVWAAPPTGTAPVILYFMGNAGALPSNGPRLAEFALQGFGIVAMNYRGAGGAPGSPSQAALTADAVAVYDQLDGLWGREITADRIVIYGTSLGSALATQLAARREAAALVLETPFTSICEVAEHRFTVIPACLLMRRDRWETVKVIDKVVAPVLILHGDQDRIVPIELGRQLLAAARKPKRMIDYPGGRHNDLRLHGAGIDTIGFLRETLGR